MLSDKRRKEIYKYLKNVYYDISGPGSFVGAEKLYHIVKSKGIKDIGLYTIKNGFKIKMISVFKNLLENLSKKQKLL